MIRSTIEFGENTVDTFEIKTSGTFAGLSKGLGEAREKTDAFLTKSINKAKAKGTQDSKAADAKPRQPLKKKSKT